MMRHHHGTPFEMVEFKWHVRLPIFVARQWIRHRTANVNEYSMRYSEPIEDYFLPIPEEVRKQSQTNKQGGTEVVPFDEAIEIIQKWEEHMENAFSLYNKTNEKDIAREISRIALPLSSYTEWYWKNDLRNTFNFLMLRLDEHAQEEIRVYAEKMAHVIKQITPLAYEAFEDYILNAKTFSALEMNALEKILQGTPLDQAAEEAGLKKRELKEFKEKLPI